MQARTLKEVNKAIAKVYPHVFLVKGDGCFYVSSNDEKTALKIANMYCTSIYVCYLNQQTVIKWVHDVERILNK